MPSAMSIHFESDHPFIAVPLECETIEDLQDRIDEILKKPYDMIAFDAGCFNGTINLSQLWNALLFIARDAEQPSVLFSCDKSKLPEMYQTDNDYATILRFAIRSALIDAVKIEGSLDEDDIDDIAGQAVDLGSVPIIVIRADQGAKADELVQKMESRWDLEAKTFELAVPVQTKEDIQALEDAAKAFHEAHHDATVIPSAVDHQLALQFSGKYHLVFIGDPVRCQKAFDIRILQIFRSVPHALQTLIGIIVSFLVHGNKLEVFMRGA